MTSTPNSYFLYSDKVILKWGARRRVMWTPGNGSFIDLFILSPVSYRQDSSLCDLSWVLKGRFKQLLIKTEGFPCGSACKESVCNAGDLGYISGLIRSPGEGKGYPLQYSGLENSIDYTVHGITNSQIDWKTFTQSREKQPRNHLRWDQRTREVHQWWNLEHILILSATQPLNHCCRSEREVAQSCMTLWDPMDCSLPGSSIHGIFQTRILGWVAISFSRRSSQTRDWTRVSHTVGRHFTIWATGEVAWLLFVVKLLSNPPRSGHIVFKGRDPQCSPLQDN